MEWQTNHIIMDMLLSCLCGRYANKCDHCDYYHHTNHYHTTSSKHHHNHDSHYRLEGARDHCLLGRRHVGQTLRVRYHSWMQSWWYWCWQWERSIFWPSSIISSYMRHVARSLKSRGGSTIRMTAFLIGMTSGLAGCSSDTISWASASCFILLTFGALGRPRRLRILLPTRMACLGCSL